jgi:hypothetical protein
MSIRSAADAVTVEGVPKAGTGLLLAVAAAIVSPFDCVLAGMIRAGLGVGVICAYLGPSHNDPFGRPAPQQPRDRFYCTRGRSGGRCNHTDQKGRQERPERGCARPV